MNMALPADSHAALSCLVLLTGTRADMKDRNELMNAHLNRHGAASVE